MKESNDIENNYGFYNDYLRIREYFPRLMEWYDRYRYKKVRRHFMEKTREGMIKYRKDLIDGRGMTYPDIGTTNVLVSYLPSNVTQTYWIDPDREKRIREERDEKSRQLYATMGVVGKMLNDKS